jgi:hypothetical protein
MQIISRRVSEGIVFDGYATVTVVEISGSDVTLDITGPDGETERVTLPCSEPERAREPKEELVLVST